MSKIKLLITLLVFFISFTSALAIPMPPHRFYGTITIGGNPAKDGITITAKVDGDTYTTATKDGKYGYDPCCFDIKYEEGRNGKTVYFYIAGREVGTYKYESGSITRLDLSTDSFCGDKVCNPGEDYMNCPQDCPVPPILTPGPGPALPTPKRALAILTLDFLTVQNGTSEYLILKVSNTGELKETGVKITFAGIPLAWIEITPTSANISANTSQDYTAKITVPSTEPESTRTIAFTATSKEGTKASKNVSLIITVPTPLLPFAPVPTQLSISINQGANSTNSTSVNLTLFALNAIQCRYSNDNITWSEYENYTNFKTWELDPKPGIKTVYYQCRNEAGESAIAKDEIELLALPIPSPLERITGMIGAITGAVASALATPIFAVILTLVIMAIVLTIFRIKFVQKIKR